MNEQRYRVQFDFGYKGTEGKKMDDTLVTQPDMSLTVSQLLENHTRGVTGQAQTKTPLYFDIEVPTIRDITDVQEYKEHLKDKLKEVNSFIKTESDERKADKDRRAAEAEKDDKSGTNGSGVLPPNEVPLPDNNE